MKRLLTIRYSESAFNISFLLIRLAFGLLMLINHGLPKLLKYSSLSTSFYDPFGIGHKWSLLLVIFAELFCALFVAIGLFTRVVAIPLVIAMAVAVFMYHKGQGFEQSEMGTLYLVAFLSILLCGPGKISVDGLIGK